MRCRLPALVALAFCLGGILPVPGRSARANPWNGKVVLQAFWWDCENRRYPVERGGWYTYLARLCPRLRAMGFDGLWIPAPSKGNSGGFSMGYDPFDHYDLGDKDQKGTVATRFGDKDALLRLIAVAHANGLEVYPDIVLNHCAGGQIDPDAPEGAGDRFKRFRYPAFAGPDTGRWPKSWLDFHANPLHGPSNDDWRHQMFGPDICYRDPCVDPGKSDPVRYMRDNARAWLVWLQRQTDADGFRFDAVKHFPPQVVEDLLFNVFGQRRDYFAVGEYVGGAGEMDAWARSTLDRSGTFDFAYRAGLADIVEHGGFFDMGSLPGLQQQNRFKTVLFVNNHDTWRGAFWDSNANDSLAHDDRDGDFRRNREELAPTIDPDNPRADVAYAAAFAVDGSVCVYYEDLFVNSGPDRKNADPRTVPTRAYVENLVRSHRRLRFKDGAYKVRFQGSPDLLVIERSRRALIGLNDHGSDALRARVQTDFGPNVRLRDYSGAGGPALVTDAGGRVEVSVPPMSYRVWGPASLVPGPERPRRRTTQQFELADDLGDARARAPGYGGRLVPGAFRAAGAVYAAAGSTVRVQLFTNARRSVALRANRPDAAGRKSRTEGAQTAQGIAAPGAPLRFQFQALREGYYLLQARLGEAGVPPTGGRLVVEYAAPASSARF